MPRGKTGGGGTVYTEPDPTQNPQQDQTLSPSGQRTGRAAPDPIATIERASRSTLPTSIVSYLSGTNDPELAKTAKILARQMDIKPWYLFGTHDPSKYVSPITGQPMSYKEVQRFTDNFSPVAIASMLAQATAPTGNTKETVLREIQQRPPDTDAIVAYSRAMARHVGDDVPATLGVALATKLAHDGAFSPQTFGQNIDWVKRWWESYTSKPVNEGRLLSYAVAVSTKGKMRSVTDVQDALYGAGSSIEHDFVNYIKTTPEAMFASREFKPEDFAQLGPDYYSQVKQIESRIRFDQEAFAHSFIGKGFTQLGHYANATQKAWLDVGTGVVGAAAQLAALAPGEMTNAEAYQRTVGVHQYLWQRVEGGDTIGSLFAEDVHAPHWVGKGMDFYLQWYTDPLVIAGRGAEITGREARLLPGLLNHTSLVETGLGKVPGVKVLVEARQAAKLERAWSRFDRYIPKFADSHESRSLFKAGVLEGNTAKFLRKIERLRGVYEARNTLDEAYMMDLATRIREAGLPADEALKAWKEGIVAHFTGVAPEGTIAADVVKARLNLGRTTYDKALKTDIIQGRAYAETTSGLVVPENTAQQLAKEVYEGGQQTGAPGWLSMEAPGRSVLAEYGPRRIVNAVVTSQGWTEKALGKRSARLISINPGRMMSVHDNPAEYMLLHARRWGQFTESEARVAQAKILDIATSGVGYEHRIAEAVQDLDKVGWDRMTSHYNLDPSLKDQMFSDIYDPVFSRNSRVQTFGVADEQPIINPLTEAQLRNQIFVQDPLYAKQVLNRYISMRSRVMQNLKQALGKEGKLLTDANVSAGVLKAIDHGHDLYKGWLKFWKFGTVARPAYIPRVIGIDENLRFLATTSSLTDRLIGLKLASESEGRIRSALTAGAKPARAVEDALFEKVLSVGDDTVKIPRAGALEYEPLAANKVRQADLLDDVARHAQGMGKAIKAGQDWTVLDAATDPRVHMAAWVHDLTFQLGGTAPGKVALKSVQLGDDIATTERKLVEWARQDSFVTLTSRIGVDPGDVESWASDLASVVHGYTMGDSSIAALALEGDRKALETQLLRTTQVGDRPPIHGPTVENATDGNIVTRFTNAMYDSFVRVPEDALNRQPFYKIWKTRSEEAMYRGLDHIAQTNPEALREIKAAGYAPRVLQPGTDVSAIEHSSDYYYHLTPAGNMESIRTKGVIPKQTFYGIDPATLTADQRAGRAFVAETPDIAMNATGSTVDKVLIRIPRGDVPGLRADTAPVPGSFYSRTAIKTGNAEILGADGEWHTMADTARALGKGPGPQMRDIIDRASRNFALGQVRRVMFDFTRQSRFTELLQHVFPFPQPFFEGFQAWGHIAYRNPGAIGRGRVLFDLGRDSGAIEKDPVSGEYGISWNMYRPAAIAYSTLFGGNPELAKHLTFFTSLSSMNMLTSGTIKFSGDGAIGKVVGGVPIPVPGLMPWWQIPLQHQFANSNNQMATGWLFQFGPNTQLLPGPVRAVARALWPDSFGDSSQQSMALSIIEAYHRFGLDVDKDGKPIPTKRLADMAAHDASQIMGMRGIMGLFAPAALRISFEGQKEDYAAFQNYVDAAPSFTAAVKKWVSDHPDKFMIPAGKTFYDAGYGPGQKAPRIPASQLVGELYNTPGIGDFMKTHPEWAALALIGTDPAIADAQDFPTFARLIGNGMLKYKNPADYWDTGESNVVWPEIDKFYKQVWNPGLDKMDTLGVDQQDNYYQSLIQKRREFLLSVATQHPNWAAGHLHPLFPPNGGTDPIGYDWPDSGNQDGTPIQVIRHDAWNIVHTPGLDTLPGVQALQQYMDGTQQIQEAMWRQRVTDITGTNATKYMKQYSTLVKGILTDAPDFEPFLRNYFGVQLGNDGSVQSTQDLVSDFSQVATERLGIKPAVLAKADNLDTQLEGLFDRARRGYDTASERSADYLKASDLIDSTYAQNPKVVEAWWKTQGQSYRADYKLGLATKPTAFYSRWDFHLAGVNVSDQAAGWLHSIAEARVAISKQKELDPTYTSSTGYKAIDAFVRTHMGKDKTFDSAISDMNSWTWSIKANTDYTQGKAKTAQAWDNILGMFDALQPQIDKLGLSGVNYGSDAEKRTYKAVQNKVLDITKTYFKWSPAFEQQWRDLEEQLGSPLIGGWFLPDDYFGAIGKAA